MRFLFPYPPFTSPRRQGGFARALGALILGTLAACGTVPEDAAPPLPPDTAAVPAQLPAIEQPRSRWVPVPWDALPGWQADQVGLAWPALLRSCERPAPAWAEVCKEARALPMPDERSVRDWLQRRLQPYQVQNRDDGRPDGLITGYYEPLVDASREARGAYRVPLHQPPADLGQRQPYWSRAELDTVPAARAALRGREIAYVADPLDVLVLQIQGSGRLQVTERDGSKRLVRVAFAGHNQHPYRSVGRWLVDQGAFSLEQASWPAIKQWARANPTRVQQMLHVNPRVVFFREEPLLDPTIGPVGAQGVPLTPGRSIAVDRESVPYGTPVWIDTTEPLLQPGAPARPLQRLVVAQDTGSAIVGAVRADYFWGWTEGAGEYAGRMKQPLRMWALWPRSPS
ncbi:transglycosylase [Caldimonas brevitalea]|uniref:peptidoglycan lytic exotransglycosylase n=2 Tax=Caldimonas brevitalea TaxID=413882 RepID=A0A0G3BUE3_9BURK|nr:MltA domain-containing protein [Caldimonas brevitalea]AKJ31643.1 transglycosylase [Caldimonas brevitalea]